jgi:hypothetical protein
MTLSEKHTIEMDNAVNRVVTAILVQVRTNISTLYTYLSKINIADTDRCVCSFLTLIY